MAVTVLGALVDELGHLNAKISDLNKRAEEIKEILKLSHNSTIDGSLFRASVSVVNRKVMDSVEAGILLAGAGIDVPYKDVCSAVVRISSRKVA